MTSNAATPCATPGAAIPLATCSLCHRSVDANSNARADAIVSGLLDAELWPVDSELVTEIRAMFLTHWGMDKGQADARMSRLHYSSAAALVPVVGPGAIGSAYAGGIYAGIMRGVDGAPDEHLVLMSGQAEGVSWDAACAWAKSIGGELPSRREQRLLFINLKDEFKDEWYWSGEQYGPSSSDAWGQYFLNGDQYNLRKSYEGRARAVRRLPI